MAEFGIAMDGRVPIAKIPEQARAAEEGGASTLWIACHLFLRDPVTTAALALGATKRIRIALMAMSPYTTHPVYIAMAAASLAEMYPGRVIHCLGAGAPADLKASGIDSPRPLVTISEAAQICRSLFAGEMADFHGKVFNVEGRRLANGPVDMPIGIDPIRRPIGFVLRGAHHAENIRLGGASLDQAALAAAYAAENWAEVDRLVSDDVVRRHAACGTPAQVKARLAEYGAFGLDEVIIGGMDDASAIAVALAAAQA
jgi:alkanesulfonate monooxygenase SsuD/methylene tetrahydromethanopterin reductase-like flavin-dependent oxidoreductase (luciferase family)